MYYKKKILFVLPSLCAGGAERVMSFVSQQLNSNNFDVKLIVLGFKKDAVYNVDAIEVKYLNKKRLLTSVTALLRIFIREKPSIIVSSIGHVNMMMGLFTFFFRKTKFVGRESTVLSKRLVLSKTRQMINRKLVGFFYKRLNTIVCQSEDMKQDFEEFYQINTSKLAVINNPITEIKEMARNEIKTNTINFITVGRLSEEKGHFRILEGLSKIKGYHFIYTIIGSGPLLTEIKEKTVLLGLQDKISFIPFTHEVLDIVSQNDYFLQGSYVEGFPNALLESCTVGTPVIAFNAPGGTKEIVINGVNGFLVESELDFYSVLNSTNQLKSIDRNDVRLSVMNKFNPENIINQYKELFNKILTV